MQTEWESAIAWLRRTKKEGLELGVTWAKLLAGDIIAVLFVNNITVHTEWGRAVTPSNDSDQIDTAVCLLLVDAKEKRANSMSAMLEELRGGLSFSQFFEVYNEVLCEFIFSTVMALAYRERTVSYFPKLFRQAFWNSQKRTNPLSAGLARPWDAGVGPSEGMKPWRDKGVSTITLSLDLRKSTFAMNEARDMKLYANWVEALVILLRRIGHDNLAVFDKFTGDGVIVHFLIDHINEILEKNGAEFRADFFGGEMLYAIDAPHHSGSPKGSAWRNDARMILRSAFLAARCAREMIVAVEYHLRHLLRDNLRFSTGLLGAGVGIALDNAIWSMDRDGNPVVVGPGVVNACRLTDAAAGLIQMPGDIAQKLMGWRKDFAFEKYVLNNNKDYSSASVVEAWRIGQLPGGLTRTREQIANLAQKTWLAVLDRDPGYSALEAATSTRG